MPPVTEPTPGAAAPGVPLGVEGEFYAAGTPVRRDGIGRCGAGAGDWRLRRVPPLPRGPAACRSRASPAPTAQCSIRSGRRSDRVARPAARRAGPQPPITRREAPPPSGPIAAFAARVAPAAGVYAQALAVLANLGAAAGEEPSLLRDQEWRAQATFVLKMMELAAADMAAVQPVPPEADAHRRATPASQRRDEADGRGLRECH